MDKSKEIPVGIYILVIVKELINSSGIINNLWTFTEYERNNTNGYELLGNSSITNIL